MNSTLRVVALSLAAAAAFVLPCASQDHSARKPEFSTFNGSDATFQIKYPQYLVRCEHRDGENPDVWSPEKVCVAYIPACDSSGHAGDVLACLAYPTRELHGSELQAAAFAVSRIGSFHTAKECLQVNQDASDVHEEKIGGVKFQTLNSVETETNYVAEHSIYRTFHKSACYELDVNLSLALDSAFAAEDKPRKLSASEREKIKAGLAQALEGFRFLK
jgi:hypothetical protein